MRNMGKNPIQVYGRLKPISSRERLGVEDYIVLSEDGVQEALILTHKPWGELINNKPESHTFRFKKIFGDDIKQEAVFDTVAKPVADSVLEGYNGTVFAYGQTGSGKTYSITGGTNGYDDRGIVPRTVEYTFKRIAEATECTYKVRVSYLEIYNENGFDLLNPDHRITKLEDLERVTLLEDEKGFTHLRNLVLHEATSEKQVLDLLFQGDVNRVIAETPMNPNSSRSHCIFTLHLEIRRAGSSVVRRSKLNLVDLAGSERVYKSGIDGKILMQAKHINLSLHYLEQVIVALSDDARKHIPYRNCMMTTVLKDTLGGNCLTTMIATMSLAKTAIEETLSTCRFAQRVALINNEAIVNEEVDLNAEIAILRKEVARLKRQLQNCNLAKVKESLSKDEIAECKRLVDKFSCEEDDIVAEFPDIPQDMRIIKQCFLLFKDSLREARREAQLATDARLREQLDTSTKSLHQRNLEIIILTNQVKELKSVIETMSTKEAGFCADELRLNIDSASQTSFRGADKEAATLNLSHRTDRSQLSIASAIYQKYSTEDRQAFTMFVSEQHSTRAHVKALKAKLTLKSQELKELASRAERSQEKSHSLGKMLENLRADESVQHGLDFEAGLQDRISQEESIREDNAVNLRKVKNEIIALREEIESEKMHLVSTFEKWKLAADNPEAACLVETGSPQSIRNMFEENCSVSSYAMEKVSGDHGDDGSEREALASPPSVCNEDKDTTYNQLKIGMGDVHRKKPYRCQKHGINYSNLIAIPTDGRIEKTSISSHGSARSIGMIHQQDYMLGADALAKLRELSKDTEDAKRLENKHTGTQLISTRKPERDVDKNASCCNVEETCFDFSRQTSSEIVTERSDYERSAHRDVTSLHKDLEGDKFNSSFCNRYLVQKNNAEPEDANIEIDDMVLTGDPEIDEEVINFYRARNKLFS